MTKTILFDLDGTLLPIDIEEFVKSYLVSISSFCAHMVEPKYFTGTLLKSTGIMLRNEGPLTNEEAFMADFIPAIGHNRESISSLLESYYTGEFPNLKKFAGQAELSDLIVQAVINKNYRIILATNPIFPRLAIEERMRWAGIKDFPWSYVTTYENSTACKPNLKYYRELINKFDLNPQDCWMIGNDSHEDMAASRLGFKTYLVTDYLLERNKDYPEPEGKGTLKELLNFIETEL